MISPFVLLLLSACSTPERPERSVEELFEHYRIEATPGALSIAQESLGDAELEKLLSDPRTPDLTSIELSGNRISSQGVFQLLNSPKTQHLRFINLANNQLNDEAIAALADSPRLTGVSTLLLAGNTIGPVGAAKLADSPHLKSLRVLSLGNQSIGDEGAAALTRLSSIDTLDLRNAAITASGAAQLLEHSQATTLLLAENPLHEGRLKFERFSDQLIEVDLRNCSLGLQQASELRTAEPGEALTSLNLSINPLGDAGVEALNEAVWLQNLNTLEAFESGSSLETRKALRESWGKRGGLKVETR